MAEGRTNAIRKTVPLLGTDLLWGDSDLYGEDILLWSERQGETCCAGWRLENQSSDQVDWPHVVDEIEHSHAQRPDSQDEIARLTARLIAAEALVKDLRSRLDAPEGRTGPCSG